VTLVVAWPPSSLTATSSMTVRPARLKTISKLGSVV